MADGRLKLVRSRLARIHDRANFILDRIDRTEGEVQSGDRLEIPSVAGFTVVADGSTTGNTAQAATAVPLNLDIDREPAIFVNVGKRDSIQLLNGTWASQLAEQGLTNLRNSMDSDYLDDAATEGIKSATDGEFVVNPAGDSITRADLLNAMAKLGDQDGSNESNWMWVCDTFFLNGVRNIAEWQPNDAGVPEGMLGIALVGRLFGVPVFKTNSTPRAVPIAVSATSVTTNVCTMTVADSTIFTIGEPVSSSGFTVELDAGATVIDTPTSTTVTAACTTGDGPNGTGNVILDASRNLLIDRTFSHAALQAMPATKLKDVPETTNQELEVSTVFGFVTRNGRAIAVLGPTTGI